MRPEEFHLDLMDDGKGDPDPVTGTRGLGRMARPVSGPESEAPGTPMRAPSLGCLDSVCVEQDFSDPPGSRAVSRLGLPRSIASAEALSGWGPVLVTKGTEAQDAEY